MCVPTRANSELIATGVGEVCVAVNHAKHTIDPSAKMFPPQLRDYGFTCAGVGGAEYECVSGAVRL